MGLQKNVLIVLAAGEGRRMGKKIPKMLLPVMGKPLLYWALKNIEKCKVVEAVVVVVPPRYRDRFEREVEGWGLKKILAMVDGGSERTDSTRNALKKLPQDCGWVGIHDGARPFVDRELIQKCFKSAKKSGAAILAVPSTDTVKVAFQPPRRKKRNHLFIQETLPRERCWNAQTPQVFRKDIAERIHRLIPRGKTSPAKNGWRKTVFTDDAGIAESMGYRVEIVPSSYENIKVTNPSDLIRAEQIIRRKKNLWL